MQDARVPHAAPGARGRARRGDGHDAAQRRHRLGAQPAALQGARGGGRGRAPGRRRAGRRHRVPHLLRRAHLRGRADRGDGQPAPVGGPATQVPGHRRQLRAAAQPRGGAQPLARHRARAHRGGRRLGRPPAPLPHHHRAPGRQPAQAQRLQALALAQLARALRRKARGPEPAAEREQEPPHRRGQAARGDELAAPPAPGQERRQPRRRRGRPGPAAGPELRAALRPQPLGLPRLVLRAPGRRCERGLAARPLRDPAELRPRGARDAHALGGGERAPVARGLAEAAAGRGAAGQFPRSRARLEWRRGPGRWLEAQALQTGGAAAVRGRTALHRQPES